MTRNLRIGTMELELECASTSQERRVLELIRSTIDTGILDALDHRLASCLPTEGVYRIDSLEIDLGTISEADLSRDLGERLVRALEPELMRRIRAYVPEQSSQQAWTVLRERLSSRELARLLDQGELMALVASRKDAVLDHVTGLVDLLDQGKLGIFSPTVLESLWEILLDAALDVCRMDDAWRSRIEAALGLPWARLQERLSPANADGAILGHDAMETMTNPVISSSIGSWDASLGIDAEATGIDLDCSSVSRDDNGPVAIPNARIQDALLCSAADVEGDGGVDSLESSSTAASNWIDLEVDSDAGLVFSRTQLLELALECGDAPRLESLVPFIPSDMVVLYAVLVRSRQDQRLRRRLRDLPASILESMAAIAASQSGDAETSVSAPSLCFLVEELLGAEREESLEPEEIRKKLSTSSDAALVDPDLDAVPETILVLPREQLLEQALERGDAVRLESLAPFVLSDVTVLHAVLMRSRLDQCLRRCLRELPTSILASMASVMALVPGDSGASALLQSVRSLGGLLWADRGISDSAASADVNGLTIDGSGIPVQEDLAGIASLGGDTIEVDKIGQKLSKSSEVELAESGIDAAATEAGLELSRGQFLEQALARGDAARLESLIPFIPSDAAVLRAILMRSCLELHLRRRLRGLPASILESMAAVAASQSGDVETSVSDLSLRSLMEELLRGDREEPASRANAEEDGSAAVDAVVSLEKELTGFVSLGGDATKADELRQELSDSSDTALAEAGIDAVPGASLDLPRRQLLELALERGDAPRLESLAPFVSSDVVVLRAVLVRSRLDQRLRRRLRELPASILESMTAVAASQPGDMEASVSAPSLRFLVEELLGTDRDEPVSSVTTEDDQTDFASLGGDAIEVDEIRQELSNSSDREVVGPDLDAATDAGLELPRGQLLELALERGDAVRLESLAPFVLSDVVVLHAVLMRSRQDQRLRRRLLDLPVSVLESMAAIADSQPGDMEASVSAPSLRFLVEELLRTDREEPLEIDEIRQDLSISSKAELTQSGLDVVPETSLELPRAKLLEQALERGDAPRLESLAPFIPSDVAVLHAVLTRSLLDQWLRRRLRDLPVSVLKSMAAIADSQPGDKEASVSAPSLRSLVELLGTDREEPASSATAEDEQTDFATLGGDAIEVGEICQKLSESSEVELAESGIDAATEAGLKLSRGQFLEQALERGDAPRLESLIPFIPSDAAVLRAILMRSCLELHLRRRLRGLPASILESMAAVAASQSGDVETSVSDLSLRSLMEELLRGDREEPASRANAEADEATAVGAVVPLEEALAGFVSLGGDAIEVDEIRQELSDSSDVELSKSGIDAVPKAGFELPRAQLLELALERGDAPRLEMLVPFIPSDVVVLRAVLMRSRLDQRLRRRLCDLPASVLDSMTAVAASQLGDVDTSVSAPSLHSLVEKLLRVDREEPVSREHAEDDRTGFASLGGDAIESGEICQGLSDSSDTAIVEPSLDAASVEDIELPREQLLELSLERGDAVRLGSQLPFTPSDVAVLHAVLMRSRLDQRLRCRLCGLPASVLDSIAAVAMSQSGDTDASMSAQSLRSLVDELLGTDRDEPVSSATTEDDQTDFATLGGDAIEVGEICQELSASSDRAQDDACVDFVPEMGLELPRAKLLELALERGDASRLEMLVPIVSSDVVVLRAVLMRSRLDQRLRRRLLDLPVSVLESMTAVEASQIGDVETSVSAPSLRFLVEELLGMEREEPPEIDEIRQGLSNSPDRVLVGPDLDAGTDASLELPREQLLELALERGDALRLESLVPFISSDATVLRAVLMRSRLDQRLRRRLLDLPVSVLESMTAVTDSQPGDVDDSVSSPSLRSLVEEFLGTEREESLESERVRQELSTSSDAVLVDQDLDAASNADLELPRVQLLKLALERGDVTRLESLIPFIPSDVVALRAVLMRSRQDRRLRRRLLDLPVSVLESMVAIAASQSGDMETSESLHSLVDELLGTESRVKEQGSIAIGTWAPREDGLTDFASPDGNSLDGSEHSRAHRFMLALEHGDARRLTGLFPFVPSDADVLRAVLLRSRLDRRLRRRLRDLPEELMKDIVAFLPKAERETARSLGMPQVDVPSLNGDAPSDPPSDAVSERKNMTETAEFSETCDPSEPQERSAASDAVAPMRLLKALVSVLDGSASADALPLEIEDALKKILLEKECRNALLRLLLVSEPILRRLAEVASDEDWHALLAARHGAGLDVLESCRLRVQEALGQVLSGSQVPSLEISWRMCMMQRPVLEAGAAPLRICRDLLMVLGRENPALPVAKALSVLERQLARERPDLFLEEAWKKARAAVSARGGDFNGVAVDNAGLVLLGPYLPRLFGMLSLLGEDGFVDLGAKIHAVRVLQFLIHGSTDTREKSLPLCRILCGLPSGVPVGEEPIPPQEQEVCEQLLEAVIQHWTILGSTSVQGLRETFLRRNGVLEAQEEQWLLRVEAGAFDMLLDKLPWGYKTVRFGWMDKTLQVEWR